MKALSPLRHWYELYPLHGTCPRCGRQGLALVDNVWIPEHEPLTTPRAGWAEIGAFGTRSSNNSGLCPIGRHTQAVEDGGVVSELRWLELADSAVSRLRNSECGGQHDSLEASLQCGSCGQYRNFNKAHTDVRSWLCRKWSRPREGNEHSRMSSGISIWRDREPVLLKSLAKDPRTQYREEVLVAKNRPPPWDVWLERLMSVVERGILKPRSMRELQNLALLRKRGYLRRVTTGTACRDYQPTPLGFFVIGRYWCGWSHLLQLVQKFRDSHPVADAALVYHEAQ